MSRSSVTVLVTIVVAFALAGCAQGAGSSPTPTTSSSSSRYTPPPSQTAGPQTPAPTRGVPTTPVAGQCPTAELAGSIAPAEGGAAGHVGVTLVLTNNGTKQCSLQGWPGVSFVGNGNGTQLGAPAAFDRSTPHPTVVMQPGGTAHTLLLVGNAANYPAASCAPQKADGFRVYPPGSTTSLFVKDDQFTACTDSGAPLLQVGALTG